MFLCEECCKKTKGYSLKDSILLKSEGRCEGCGKTIICNEV